MVKDICDADRAIVIAHLADPEGVLAARRKGCRIIHRLDEYFEENEDESRRRKHEEIMRLNRSADVTVFQSQFVFENVYPYIEPECYRIIHNGGDSSLFSPARRLGKYIGHVSWGVGERKKLDLLRDFIAAHPGEQFLLVGRHSESEISFNMPNVVIKGEMRRRAIASQFRKMKMLFFPSEKDPCPNTVVESILSGVPVCYNPVGGTVELVKDCGLPLERASELMADLDAYRNRCLKRTDLAFESVFRKYLDA